MYKICIFRQKFGFSPGKYVQCIAICFDNICKIYKDGVFLTHGDYTKEYAMKGFNLLSIKPKEIIAINTPVQYPLVERIPNKELNTILTFGRISPDKNLEIIASISKQVPARFIIAGYISVVVITKDDIWLEESLRSIENCIDELVVVDSSSNEYLSRNTKLVSELNIPEKKNILSET